MGIWYSISAQFTLHPGADPHALAVAAAAYEAATVGVVRIVDDAVTVEAEGEMSLATADALRTGLVRLIHDFGDGEAAPIAVRSSDYDDESVRYCYAGRKTAVLGALKQDVTWRLEALRIQYARELNSLADKADDAFVETEGW